MTVQQLRDALANFPSSAVVLHRDDEDTWTSSVSLYKVRVNQSETEISEQPIDDARRVDVAVIGASDGDFDEAEELKEGSWHAVQKDRPEHLQKSVRKNVDKKAGGPVSRLRRDDETDAEGRSKDEQVKGKKDEPEEKPDNNRKKSGKDADEDDEPEAKKEAMTRFDLQHEAIQSGEPQLSVTLALPNGEVYGSVVELSREELAMTADQFSERLLLPSWANIKRRLPKDEGVTK